MTQIDGGTTGGRGAGRVGLYGGIAFVVLFLVGFFLFQSPASDKPDDVWVDWWQDSDHRARAMVTHILMSLSAVGLLWFVAALRRRLQAVAGSDAAFAGGVVAAALVLLAAFGAGLMPLAHLADVPIPTQPDLIRFFDALFYGVIFGPLTYAIAAFLIPLFFAARSTGLLPPWLGIFGLVIGVASLAGPYNFGIPNGLFLLWVLIASIVLLTRDRAATGAR